MHRRHSQLEARRESPDTPQGTGPSCVWLGIGRDALRTHEQAGARHRGSPRGTIGIGLIADRAFLRTCFNKQRVTVATENPSAPCCSLASSSEHLTVLFVSQAVRSAHDP